MTSIPMELCATCNVRLLFLLTLDASVVVVVVLLIVDADEIRRLGKRFKKLDVDGSGSLSVQEFMSIPELQQNPLVQRVIDIFDTDGNGEIDFKGESFLLLVESHHRLHLEFIGGISQFSVKGDKESKLRCTSTIKVER